LPKYDYFSSAQAGGSSCLQQKDQIPSKSSVEVETPPLSNKAVVVPMVGVVVTVGTGVVDRATNVVAESPVPPSVASVMAVLTPIMGAAVVVVVGARSVARRVVVGSTTAALLVGR